MPIPETHNIDVDPSALRELRPGSHQFILRDDPGEVPRIITLDRSTKVEEHCHALRMARGGSSGTGKGGARWRLAARIPVAAFQAYGAQLHDPDFLRSLIAAHPEWQV